MNDKTTQDDLDEIEEKLKEQETEEEKTHQKVSGKSVFELQEIIKKKSEEINEDRQKKDENKKNE